MTAIAIEGVSKHYREHRALTDVDFALPAGACLALLGHNGAGKTTLMKLMLGLIRPTAGRVSVLGQDPAAAALDFRRRLAFLPENVAFHDEMTGRESLRFFARLKGAKGCERVLERVGLAFAADRRIKTYSKGMRQRLGLAQALLGEPRVLLLDEPTTGLDPAARQDFFALIAELTAGGSTVVLSSHILTELEARTELVAIMRRGRLAAWGSLDDLRQQAGLPVRIRVAAPGGAAAVAERLDGLGVKRIGDHAIDLACAVADKMAVLRHVAAIGAAVADIDVHLPSLDDLYLHFGHQEVPV